MKSSGYMLSTSVTVRFPNTISNKVSSGVPNRSWAIITGGSFTGSMIRTRISESSSEKMSLTVTVMFIPVVSK